MDEPIKTGMAHELTCDTIIDRCITAPDEAAKAYVDALNRIELLEAENERLRAALARPSVHLVKLSDTGWTIQHPPDCEDLFECEYTVLAEMWDARPTAENGVYVMHRDGSCSEWIGAH